MQSGTITRITAILFGIASAVLLARSAFGIRFNEDFMRFLDIVRDIIGVVVTPFELLIVKPIVRWLHDQGFAFELRDHWRNAFVLLWLFTASEARSRTSRPVGPPASVADLMHYYPARVWMWGALAALLGGVLAGTVPLHHPAVLWWPVATFFLYWSVDRFLLAGGYSFRQNVTHGMLAFAFAAAFASLALGWLDAPTFAGHPALFWWPVAAWLFDHAAGHVVWTSKSAHKTRGLVLAALDLGIAAAAVALALGILQGPGWLAFEHSPSPGLANLAAFVTIFAALYMLSGFLYIAFYSLPIPRHDTFLRQWLDFPDTRQALDIFAVLGFAAVIVYVAHLLS